MNITEALRLGEQVASPTGRYIPHDPTDKQQEFLALACLEAMYGGAAGGGKSDALLMAALEYAHVPGYAALILRRTYADLALPGAIMDRAKDWLVHKGVHWSDKEKRFTFPSGATLTFGYLDNENDRYRYQGAELQYIGFDELTQFPEGWYRYLLSRLRRKTGVAVPLRARAASNPGGIGHDWVRRRFVAGADPDRVFVPATLADNPHIDAEEYAKALALLDPTTRRQLLEGVWVRDSGGLVYRFDEAANVVAAAPKLTDHVLGIDYGFTDSTAFCVLGWRAHDPCAYVVEATKETGLTPSKAAEHVRALDRKYGGFERIVGDIGGLGKGYAEEARQRFFLPIEPAEKSNKRGYIDLLNGDMSVGNVKLVKPATERLVEEMLELPWDKERKQPEPGFEDHLCDAMLYGWRAARAHQAEKEVIPPTEGSAEWEAEQLEARRKAKYASAELPWWKKRGRR